MPFERKRVVVIGAGIVGTAAASWLLRDGHEVTLVDRNEPGLGASYGNAGCLNPSSVVPMAMPGTIRNAPRWLLDPLGPLTIRWRYLPRLLPWLVRFARGATPEKVQASAKALRSLLRPSLDCLLPLVRDAGAARLVQQAGHLVVYRSLARFEAEAAEWRLRRETGVTWDVLDADELRQLEPALARDYVRGILIRDNGHVSDPYRLVAALAEAFARNGGGIVRARVTGFALEDARLRAVRSEAGDLPADAAILAAGAFSAPLARMLGDSVPLESERGYHAMLRAPEQTLRTPTLDAERKFVATPMEEGLRFAGTVEFAGLAAAPDWRRARVLLAHACRMLPGLAPAEERASFWMGHRPSLPDSLPVIGPARATSDVIYAFGHGHVGMMGAPMTGQLVADLVAGRAPAIDLAPFRAARFR